jgi:hypothetical protein
MPKPVYFPNRWISALTAATRDGAVVTLPDGFTARPVPNTHDTRILSPDGKVVVRLRAVYEARHSGYEPYTMTLPSQVVWQSADYPVVEAACTSIGKWRMAQKQAAATGGEVG